MTSPQHPNESQVDEILTDIQTYAIRVSRGELRGGELNPMQAKAAIEKLLLQKRMDELAELEVHHFDTDDNDDLYELVVSPYVQTRIKQLEEELKGGES